jgi:cytochrome c oxidase assembly factor CtaG
MILGLNLTWHWSPGALIFIILLCLLYGLAIQYGQRRDPQQAVIKPHHLVAFGTCIVIMALLLLTPFDTLARTQLFAAHMVQVVFLVTLCAPLFLLACPEWLWQPVLQWPPTRSILNKLTRPFIASLIFNLTFFFWHAPNPFHYALQHGSIYHVELLSLFLASLLNWWPLIGPVRALRRLSYPLQMLYAFLDGQPVDVFAFLLVFTGVVFYPYYQIPAPLLRLGLTAYPLQAVGGTFLMIPGLVDLIVMTPLFFRWLGQMEAKAKAADQKMQEELEEEAALEESGSGTLP